ncbi:MAG: hypothetical protein R2883_03475 [Caldisericia bacterium]
MVEVGLARRMQVPIGVEQHTIMIQAVENHMPEVIIIDEIGTEEEAAACRTIAERGVQLVGTAHGHSLPNLLMNPTLSDLLGGVNSVILSDEEAYRRGTQKTVLERTAPPTFDVLIEIADRGKFVIYDNIGNTVDEYLRYDRLNPEVRVRHWDGRVEKISSPESVPNLLRTGKENQFLMRMGKKKKNKNQACKYLHLWCFKGLYQACNSPLPHKRSGCLNTC